VNAWRKFRRLSPTERRLRLEALLILVGTIAALRVASLRRCQSLLASLIRATPDGDEIYAESAAGRARKIARAVRHAALHTPCHGSCLAEALVVWSLLRRDGIASHLQIGVRRSGIDLQAHAWVALNGWSVTIDDEDPAHGFISFGRPIGNRQAIG
jgi:transglutaminase superfamily protein